MFYGFGHSVFTSATIQTKIMQAAVILRHPPRAAEETAVFPGKALFSLISNSHALHANLPGLRSNPPALPSE